MLVKSVVCKLTDLPHICIGNFLSTNNRSLQLLNQIGSIFRQKALNIFFCNLPVVRTEKQPLLWACENQWPNTWLAFRHNKGFWDTRQENQTER